MDKKIRVLLLSAPIGSGHRMAAEAIKEELESFDNIEVTHGNVFNFFPRFLGETFLACYLGILKLCPWLYQMTYAWGNKESASLWLRNFINRCLLYLGSGFLNKVKPDIVIATHATPTGIMSLYKEKHPEIFLGVVITDFTVHKWWICKNVDAYFVADESLKEKFSAGTIVESFGIPLRKEFRVEDGLELRKNFGWTSSEKVCLVMGGGDGLLPMEEIISALHALKLENLRLVAICGKNAKLKKSLAEKFGCKEKVEIIGYTNEVPSYMKAADLIISKAGGLTASESLASNLQFIIYKPLPGQEQNNASFLAKKYGARICLDITSLTSIVKEICQAKKILASYVFTKKEATYNICKYILAKFQKQD